ncbi:MAG: methyltransferase [Patescibacteria group bacterium]|jgi:release factor glutamine methyltransferase
MLSPSDIKKVEAIQARTHALMRSIGSRGKQVRFFGKTFIVKKNVFWLLSASPLIRHFRVPKRASVLDLGTGTGLIAIFAAVKGARRVLAVDISPAAVSNARLNVNRHKLDSVVEVRRSDMWQHVGNERFDVIVANLPFRDKPASDLVQASTFDAGFRAHRLFFSQLTRHLKSNGCAYLSQANFGEVDKVRQLAKRYKFTLRKIAEEKQRRDPRIFYAFLIRAKK